MPETRAAREVVFTYVLLGLVTWVVAHMPALGGSLGALVLSGVFLFTALGMARRDARGVTFYGIDLDGVLEPRPGDRGLVPTLRAALPSLLRELGFAAKVALIVFPPFAAAFAVWHGPRHPFTLQLPPHAVDFVLGHLLVVALPEEALFRGYFQTRLGDVFTSRQWLLGAEICLPALVLQSAAFAVLHFIVGLDARRLAVFFPGLLFGYLRARRGGIGAAVWFHAFSNVLSEVLTRGWL